MPKKGEKHRPESLAKLSDGLRRTFADPEKRKQLSESQRARRRRERAQMVAQPDKKRCSKCGEWKPVGEYYLMKRKLKSGGVLHYPSPACKVCRRKQVKARWDQMVSEGRREEMNARRRQNEDVARHREKQREWATARRRREGIEPRKMKLQRTEGKKHGLPAEPLAKFIEGEAENRTLDAIAAATGVHERRLTGLLRGEFDTVTLATIDKILTGLGCPEEIHFLYPAEEESLPAYRYLVPDSLQGEAAA